MTKLAGKICNQVMVKDQFRDKKYIGTMKCIACEEESNLAFKFPCSIKDFTSNLSAFIKLHTIKGCNKEKLNAPEWASGKVTMGFAYENKV